MNEGVKIAELKPAPTGLHVAPEPAPLAARVELLPIDEMSDEQLLDCLVSVEDEHQATSANFRTIEGYYRAEIERRLRDRNARALLHPRFKKVELTPQFTPYVYDVIVLKQIKETLKAAGHNEEAAKVVKSYAARQEIVERAAFDEPGSAATIDALIRKYGEHPELGPLLKRCRSRASLGEKLTLQRQVGA